MKHLRMESRNHLTPPGGGRYHWSSALKKISSLLLAVFAFAGESSARADIFQHPEDLTATIGGSATFRVETVGQWSDYSYQWYFGEIALEWETLPKLTVHDLALSDQGDYSVEVSGFSGSVRSTPARLTVVPATAASEFELQPAGRWPAEGSGACLGVKAAGGHVYTVHREMFSVYDIADPTRPERVASIPLPPMEPKWDVALPMQVVGSWVYVPRRDAGLQIVEVANPRQPRIIGMYPTRAARDVHVLGGRAYVADDLDGLLILDVRDPTNIYPIGAAFQPITRVRVIGAVAYAVKDNEFFTFNVANPSQVTRLNSTGAEPTLGWSWATDLEVAGNYGYVSAYDSLKILDLTNPAQEQVIADLFGEGGDSLDVEGNTAYLGYSWGSSDLADDDSLSGLRIIDVWNRSVPQFLNRTESRLGIVRDVDVHEGFAYLAETQGLRVVRVQNPATAREEAFRATAPGHGNLGVLGNRLLIPVGELVNLDLVDPTRLSQVAGYHQFDDRGELIDFREVKVVGQKAYALCSDPTIFQVLDLANPAKITALGSWPLDAAVGQFGLQIQGSTAYVSYWSADVPESGLTILDISNPAAIRHLSTIENSTPRLAVYGDLALGTVWDAWKLFDVSVPGRVRVVRDLDYGSGFNSGVGRWRLTIVGEFAYVAGYRTVWIVDLRNALDPRVIGELDLGEDAWEIRDIQAFGSNVHVVGWAGWNGDHRLGFLKIVNVENPRAPFLVAEHEFAGLALRVLRSGPELFVSTEDRVHRFRTSEGVPPVITLQPRSQAIMAGSQLTLFVAATGSGALTYQWYRDGVPISGATESALHIQGIGRDQAGHYSVEVGSLSGRAHSIRVEVIVYDETFAAETWLEFDHAASKLVLHTNVERLRYAILRMSRLTVGFAGAEVVWEGQLEGPGQLEFPVSFGLGDTFFVARLEPEMGSAAVSAAGNAD